MRITPEPINGGGLKEKLLEINDELPNKEAAHFLKIRPSTLNIWRCRGFPKIPYHKRGGKIYYKIPDLINYDNSCRVA